MPSSRPSPDRQHPRILHGRRRGRPLRKRQLDLLRTLLPNIEIRAPEADGTTLPVALNLDLLFPDSAKRDGCGSRSGLAVANTSCFKRGRTPK